MTETLLTLAASALLIIGSVIALISAIGLLRLPDVFARMHAASKAGAAGSSLLLLAVALRADESSIWIKVAATILFFFLTAPISAHLLARAAIKAGFRPPVLDEGARAAIEETKAD
ncbi:MULTISPECIES: monovalent cation/H(+) antiporter subunit G [unclassified Rhizobium]|uniref:monovalent cation/H(+) antiporter subunit G n=1 Tax=unclassified Rhizobium TaxID=2613769 RepID=UPI0016011CCC|nr:MULTISPECIES: monovalent cation/H(+) antiporter subunit G [unclassified Rhizobium]MBB1248409.1 monovalent cation/H(+) antiporter subunit G [Rhizobium sp. G21]MCV3766656.1 monovalent cation/H(+) antiporter subunit G [Rhizobium sp. TRM95796]